MFFRRRRRRQSEKSEPARSLGDAPNEDRSLSARAESSTDDTEVVLHLAMLGTQLSRAIAEANYRHCDKVLGAVRQMVAELRERGTAAEESAEEQPNRFVVSSLFLAKSFRFVCPAAPRASGFKEVFHYVTGVALNRHTYILTDIVPVRFAYQHAGGVRASDASNLAALEHLDRIGLGLLGHFHSHPGYGPEANHPSATDLRFVERLARGNHVAVGGIFSRDREQPGVGYVRFFAHESKAFVISVKGKDEHVRKVSDDVYRIAVADADLPFGAD